MKFHALFIASCFVSVYGDTFSPSQTPTHVPTPKTPSPAPTVTEKPTISPLPTSQPTPLPTSRPTQVPTPLPTLSPSINVECSSARCSELSWNTDAFGSSLVCGESDQSPLSGCSGEVTWTQGRSICQAAGARLCTVAELQNDEARATGCNYDTALVWAQERCDGDGHYAAWGSTLMGTVSYCLNGSTLSGTVTAAVRCCADVEACTSPTPLPSSNPVPLPTPLPIPIPTLLPTPLPSSIPSPLPTSINFTDCNGNEVSLDWLGDGFCDAGYFDGVDGIAVNLNCSEKDYDGGDCLPSTQQSSFPVPVPLSRDCTACNVSSDNVSVCHEAPASWIGDGICDDGEYGYDTYGSIDFDCATYNHDGYDCCLKDAQYETSFTGPPPDCLWSSASSSSCGALYGDPPPCWKTNKLGLTCDWLTPILGNCGDQLKNSKRPHVDVRACADSCMFNDCTEDYAVELVQTYYEMCHDVPSSFPTYVPTPTPTVSYERKIQCDVNKQQTCATRSRGDSCTDWSMECFYVQCPAGVEENGRDATGKCYRESAHVADWRTFSV